MKVLVMTLTAVAMIVGAADAQWMPPYPWGTDCDNWINCYDPWGPVEMIWDPALEQYMICGTTPVDFPQITLDLFVELETVLALDYTWCQAHRASDYDWFWYEIHGTIASNNPNKIMINSVPGHSLNFLDHLETVVCTNLEDPIPITWWYKNLEPDPWAPMLLDPCAPFGWYFEKDLCDHDFWIGVQVEMAYHQPDGAYGTVIQVDVYPLCL